MTSFFDAYNPNSFSAYSATHIAALVVLITGVVLLFVFREGLRRERASLLGRYMLAGILVVCEVSLNVWYVAEGVYSVKDTLPLELCSISLYLSVFMLIFRNRLLFQIVYFTGIGGALQALLTPVLGYAFPHYRFIEFFIAHITIIWAVLFMVWVERFRPTFKSIGITMVFLNVMLVILVGVNYITGGNYMFLARKPDTASLLDVLGPYPWYLLSLEAVALVLFLLLYAPFAGRRRSVD
ncbi:MAG: transporter permease [Paenibacillus sp.]|nr:transporter permease [Paenibacillus sp.]